MAHVCTWVPGMHPYGLCYVFMDVVEAGDRVGIQRVIGAGNRKICHDQAIGDAASTADRQTLQAVFSFEEDVTACSSCQ